MPGCIAGFQQGYEGARKAGCKQSRAASPAWWEDVVRGGEGGGDKKKQNKCAGSFTQWLNEYHKKHPVNLQEFPRAEYWTDTHWEPYMETVTVVGCV